MKREDFTAMIPENDKYVGSNIYLNGKNRRVGKKLTLCEQRGELFSWGEALSAER